MKFVGSSARSFAAGTLLCAVAGTLISLSSVADAASTTLVIGGTPAPSVALPNFYSFQPTAKDSVVSRLKFNIYNKPPWAQFDGSTGRLSGRPARSDVGTYRNITIRLTDWYGYTTLPAFSITVAPPVSRQVPSPPPNTLPTISGSPATAAGVGKAYSFTPTASDANKDSLRFSIQNKPDWAKFSTATGALSGTPAAADVGTYAKITISVTDGKASVALAAFAVVVTQISTGNASLDWTPPTQNADGSALTNLAGYTVHYGTSRTSLTQTIKVTNPGLTSYVIDNLSPGTWYFAVSSYNAAGTESAVSGVVWTSVL
jgi:Putative Ig domain